MIVNMELIKDKQTRSTNRSSNKYFLDFCNKKVIGDKNTRDWLITKNLLLDQKVIEGVMYNKEKVVIKIGNKEDMDKDYQINQNLRNYRGFVRYICQFSCQDDLKKYKYEDGSWSGQDGFCEVNGKNRTNAIIMPYYDLSSMFKYKWNRMNFDIFRKLLKEIVEILIRCNSEIGFLHNDIHLDNIMIRNTKSGLKADIIDFEKSTIDMVDVLDYKKLGVNFNMLFYSISRLDLVGNYNNLLIFQGKMRDPFENKSLDINDVYKFIDELTFVGL